MSKAPLILVVDDDEGICWALEQILTREGWRVAVAADVPAARRLLRRERPDAVLTDVRMPGESGLDLLAALKAEHADLPVVVMTAHASLDTAQRSVAAGAADQLAKPIDRERVVACLRRVLGESTLAAAARPGTVAPAESLAGSSPAMQEVFRRIAVAAGSAAPVLISGPSGSGKTTAAQAMHRCSPRAAAPLHLLSCGALDQDGRGGLDAACAAAADGTLVLDEVGDLPKPAQAALAAKLDAGTLACRLIATSRLNLTALAGAGAFRDDLVWRLSALTVQMPPIDDRRDDLPALVRALLARLAQRFARPLAVTDAAMARITAAAWPGQVRQLAHALEQAALLAPDGTIDAAQLPPAGGSAPADPTAHLDQLAARMLHDHPGSAHERYLAAVEEPLLRAAMTATAGNQLRAAELLGINRTTLRKRLGGGSEGGGGGGG